MKQCFLIAGVLAVLCGAPVLARAADLSVDAQASSIKFLGKSTLHDIHGKVTAFSGSLSFVKGPQAVAVEVKVPVKAMITGLTAEDQNTYAMFEVASFPGITLSAADIDLSALHDGVDQPFIARGNLAMHGVSREVSVPVKIRRDHGRLVCEGSFPVSLKDFGLKPPKLLFIKVADQVQVEFSVVFASP